MIKEKSVSHSLENPSFKYMYHFVSLHLCLHWLVRKRFRTFKFPHVGPRVLGASSHTRRWLWKMTRLHALLMTWTRWWKPYKMALGKGSWRWVLAKIDALQLFWYFYIFDKIMNALDWSFFNCQKYFWIKTGDRHYHFVKLSFIDRPFCRMETVPQPFCRAKTLSSTKWPTATPPREWQGGRYVVIFVQVANNGYVLCRFQFCQPLPNLCANIYVQNNSVGSWPIVTFTMCLLKDDMGTDDVTDMQILICAKYLYPISKGKAAAHNVEDVLVAMHDWMHDLSFRWLHLIPPQGWKWDFTTRCKMFEAPPMGNSWHNAKVLDAHPLQPTQHPCKAWIPHHTPTLPAISHPSATCLATALWTSPGPAVFPPIPHNWIEHLWRLASIKTVCQPLKCFGGLWTMREKGARGKKMHGIMFGNTSLQN